MTDPRQVKRSKVIELQLIQAAGLLLQPQRFRLKRRTLESYEIDLRLEDLEAAMNKLEVLASEHGAKSVFWRRLQKVALSMDRSDKVDEYERRFHAALDRKV